MDLVSTSAAKVKNFKSTKNMDTKQNTKPNRDAQAVSGGTLLADAEHLKHIAQVAAGLHNVEQYTKGKANNHIEINWCKETDDITTFYFASTNLSAVKAMCLATKTPIFESMIHSGLYETRNY